MPTTVIQCLPTWLELTQNWIYNQIQYLPGNEFETHIVCQKTENIDRFGMPNMHVLSGYRRWRELLPKRILRPYYSSLLTGIGKKVRADVVHSHFGNHAWRNQPAVSRIPARHVVTFYGYDVNRLPVSEPVWRTRYADLFAKLDRVLCEGPYMGATIVRLGCPPEKVLVHHLGVDLEKIVYRPRTWVPGTTLRVLLAGRFVEKKGFPDALRALAKLKKDVKLEITIVGDAKADQGDNMEKAKILDAIQQGSLSGNVHLLGFQPYSRLLEEAYAHHIFLSPSLTAGDGDSEGGAPVTLIEMAASGMPVVSTRHCDIPAVVIEGKTGLLAEEHDVEGLAKHLRWLVEHPSDWEPMLQAARKHIDENYDVRIQGKKLGQIYKDVL